MHCLNIWLTVLLAFSPILLSAQRVEDSTFEPNRVSAVIGGAKFTGFLGSRGNSFFLFRAKHKKILQEKGSFFTWQFRDINGDGYKDIVLDHGGNTPEVFTLFLFLPSSKTFKEVKDFNLFPDPKKIKGTRYYYSYHKSGCADLNWQSDLFYIQNFKAICLGSIISRDCGKNIYITRMTGTKTRLLKKLSTTAIQNISADNKWSFIRRYWTRNYRLFL